MGLPRIASEALQAQVVKSLIDDYMIGTRQTALKPRTLSGAVGSYQLLRPIAVIDSTNLLTSEQSVTTL
jgi:hypothetical protein